MNERPSEPCRNILAPLPTQFTQLIGRDQDVAAICSILGGSDVRLLTLTGSGGVGKTRLAVHVATSLAKDFIDGVYFIPLAPISDPDLIMPTIAHQLSIKEREGLPLLDLLKLSLQDKRLLLLLDNFEQVVAAAPQLEHLLAGCPQLTILVTSRAVLHLQAEQVFPVAPLALPDLAKDLAPADIAQSAAVALFLQRVCSLLPSFEITAANARAIAELCVRLDGLPLALELAAARVRLLPPQALLARLSQRLQLLTSAPRTSPDRQQTLRKTLQWSYDLLGHEEQSLFRRLGVCAGGWTMETAEALGQGSDTTSTDVLNTLASLLDHSLIQQSEQEAGEPRFLMLETIREYALECLQASGETEAMRRQHATFFLQLVEEAEPKLRSAEQDTWRRQLEVEQDNLRAALRWTLESQEAEMGLWLAGALLAFWRSSNQDREGRSWCEQVLAQSGTQVRTAARAKALLAAGTTTMHQDLSEAQRLLAESISIGREVGAVFRRNLAHALAMLTHVSLLQGDPSAARELAEESVRLFQEVGEAWGSALALNFLGRATLELGDPIAARPLLEESAALFRMIGDRQRLAMPLIALGLVALRLSDYAGARTHFEEALAVARETGDELYIAAALARLGTVALRVGDYQQAATLYGQSLALIWAQGYSESIALGLAGLAELANRLGQPERAARLVGAIEGLHEVSGIRLSPLRRAEHDRAVEGIHALLDEATFVAAWQEGRMMPLERAITYALATIDALSTEASPPEVDTEVASSSGALSSQPSPRLSPRRALNQQFGGLTAREREVARLVAQGKSNRTIADELVVGISTVEAHITHIFTKLGFSSRAQIAAWAVEKGLVQVQQDMEIKRQGR